MKARVNLHGLEESITRPISISVTKDILKQLGIQKDVYTNFDPKEKLRRRKNNIGNIVHLNTKLDEFVAVEVNENSVDDMELSLLVHTPDTYPIYQDLEIPAYIQAMSHRRKLTLTFKYYNKSRSQVDAICNKLRAMTTNDGMYRRHSLEYSYALPNIINRFLIHMNDLKNIRLEDKDKLSIDQYATKYMDNRLVLGGSLDNVPEKFTPYIREAQVYLEAAITEPLHEIKSEYEDEDSMWSLYFTYELQYEKPIALVLEYPMVVWNTMIDEFWYSFEEYETVTNRAVYRRSEKDLMNLVQRHPSTDVRPRNNYYTIPLHDDRVSLELPSFMTRMFSVLVTVDPDDPTFLFNPFTDLENVGFKKVIERFILEHDYSHIGKLYESIINISLVEGNYQHVENHNVLYMDKDGNIRSKEPLDLKKIYRVMFNIFNDLDYLTPKTQKRLSNYLLDEMMRQYTGKPISYAADDIIRRYMYSSHDSKLGNSDDLFIDIYADILQVDPKDVINGVNPSTINTLIFRISKCYGLVPKTVGIFNNHVGFLEPKRNYNADNAFFMKIRDD